MTAWNPIDTIPDAERVLVHNELWDDTYGAVQIAERLGSDWMFESGMSLDGEEPEYLPLGWMPLPDYPRE